jgi:DNA-binding winged helix-turn-helix (wHTH) protein
MNKKSLSILLIAIAAFFVLSFSIPENQNEPFSEKVKISLRQVGNQLLLLHKDSVSLILPVKQIAENKYQLSFEKQFSLEPNQLVDVIKENFEKANILEDYLVEVLQCTDGEVAYSYQIKNDTEKDIVPCAGRTLPINCYKIDVIFTQRGTSSFNRNMLLLFGVVLVFLVIIFYKRKPVIKEVVISDEFITIGSFQFFPNQHKLQKAATEISLSKKECELLEIFIANPNQIIKREELTKKVWEDNGVFVGRSLDTYISKLRKKLKDDPSIKLTNAHGVGYKLEINL